MPCWLGPCFVSVSYVFSRAGVRLVGQRHAQSFGVAFSGRLGRRSHASVGCPCRCPVDIDQSRCCSASFPGGCGAAVAPSVAPSNASIQSSRNIILRRQVTVVDLGLISKDARSAAGGMSAVVRLVAILRRL